MRLFNAYRDDINQLAVLLVFIEMTEYSSEQLTQKNN